MFFRPCETSHPDYQSTAYLPPVFEPSRIEGAEHQCYTGSFGMINGQLIEDRQYKISMHHFFLEGFTCLRFPFDRFQPVLLYNYGIPMPVRMRIGWWQQSIGQGEIAPDAHYLFTGQSTMDAVTLPKGRYTFFTVDTGSLHLQTVLRHPILSITFLNNLRDFLGGVSKRMEKKISA